MKKCNRKIKKQVISVFVPKHNFVGYRIFRWIIGRRNKHTDTHNPKRWILKLNDNEISQKHIRTAMININSKYIDVPTSDTLTRLKLGKTQFNNSLHSYNQVDTPLCNTCNRELNEDHIEDYLYTPIILWHPHKQW